MSLRLRLSVVYTILSVAFLLVFGIIEFATYNQTIMNEIDRLLVDEANQILNNMLTDQNGNTVLNHQVQTQIGTNILYQFWDQNHKLQFSNLDAMTTPLNPETIDLMEGNRLSSSTDDQYRVLSVPLRNQRGYIGTLQVAYNLTLLNRSETRMTTVMLGVALAAAVITALIIWLINGHELGRIRLITETTNQIRETNDPSLRIPEVGAQHDELGVLTSTFNDTMERLEYSMNAQRRFLADVSHELRTPLTVIKGNANLLRQIGEIDEESLHSIESEADRLTRLVNSLLMLERIESGHESVPKEPIDLADLLLEVYQDLIIVAESKQQQLQIMEIDLAIIEGNRDQLKQVFLNLISNAIKYTPEKGDIFLALKKDKQYAQVSVKDNGPGIPKDEIPLLFERFYRGEKSRQRQRGTGFGLGLSIAYWIVRSYGGWIEVKSEFGVSTEFITYLPLYRDDSEYA
ncbi:MAG: HAMP domain-containing histidine kinase [Anaerolineaceae bacterium]|nr:HAMP domain-containing histidine kinase [Anaerolineaceae bacterium]